MLNRMRNVFLEFDLESCEEACKYQLSTEELPEEWSQVDTCFAMFAYGRYSGFSSIVIFEDGEVGLECSIGLSKWYLLAGSTRILAGHQLKKEIDYYFNNGWNKKC